MTSLPPAAIKLFPENSLEKRVYNLIEKYKEYMPVNNDRNRLGFALVKYKEGKGDAPAISLKSNKITIKGITIEELSRLLDGELSEIK
jgi:hypothetical protein